MVCKNYKFLYSKEEDGVTKNYIYAEIFADTTPSQFPTNADNIDAFPKNFPSNSIVFAGGSLMYIVDSGEFYMATSDGTWVKQ